MVKYNGRNYTDQEWVWLLANNPDLYAQFRPEYERHNMNDIIRQVDALIATNRAVNSGNANDVYRIFSEGDLNMPADLEKYLDNTIARENTAIDQQFQTEMRDTSLTSAASQLSSLGLSTSNVINTGGASSGVSSAAPSTDMHSLASLKQQRRINDYNNKMGLAKSIIGMAGSMASSGIYGASLNAAKNAAAKLAAATAHSSLNVMKYHNGYGSGSNLAEFGYNQPMPAGYEFLE